MGRKKSGRKKIEEYIKDGYAEKFTLKIVVIMLWVNLFYGSFVIKTHSAPNNYLRLLLLFKLIKVTYSVSFPIDCILSAFDHRMKEKIKGKNPFQRLEDFRSGVRSFKNLSGYPLRSSDLIRY